MLTERVSLHSLPFSFPGSSKALLGLLRYFSGGWFDLNLAMHSHTGLSCNLVAAPSQLHLSSKVQQEWDKCRSVFSIHIFFEVWLCVGENFYVSSSVAAFYLNLPVFHPKPQTCKFPCSDTWCQGSTSKYYVFVFTDSAPEHVLALLVY